ncbi:hypothetical protein D9619_001268 [Psilocybe cf. subviscida]|uniref:EKC/KEOPS complex subunit CGI121 n=1 Tax=Psilocybe cf. subviscida TaxID=2480587 RepID=A0A8H5BGX8_9AGAR|nr:hypothetical protein D9619_001268 [Psilocybe cf. subviscida]
MESTTYSHFDASHSRVHIALLRKVSNASALRARIIAAATAEGEFGESEREAVNFAFVDPRLITSKLHIETAIIQALIAESQGATRTRTVHSEILYNLNPTHNITEAIRRYGVSDTNTDVLVVRIDSPGLSSQEVEKRMLNAIEGTIVPLTELEHVTDWAAVKKYNKLNNEVAVKEAAKDPKREHMIVDEIVVSSVAMKSVMN